MTLFLALLWQNHRVFAVPGFLQKSNIEGAFFAIQDVVHGIDDRRYQKMINPSLIGQRGQGASCCFREFFPRRLSFAYLHLTSIGSPASVMLCGETLMKC